MLAIPMSDELSSGAPHSVVACEDPSAVVARSDGAPLSSSEAARFRALVDDQFNFVWRFLRGLGVLEANVDDAAQHVFWITALRLTGITRGSERGFLLSTARGVAANARRASARLREVADEDALERSIDAAPTPEQAVATKQARRNLDAFLEGLPDEMRIVFVLFELEGQTMAAIAVLLGVPPGTVASRLRRARESFHAAARSIQDEGGSAQ